MKNWFGLGGEGGGGGGGEGVGWGMAALMCSVALFVTSLRVHRQQRLDVGSGGADAA